MRGRVRIRKPCLLAIIRADRNLITFLCFQLYKQWVILLLGASDSREELAGLAMQISTTGHAFSCSQPLWHCPDVLQICCSHWIDSCRSPPSPKYQTTWQLFIFRWESDADKGCGGDFYCSCDNSDIKTLISKRCEVWRVQCFISWKVQELMSTDCIVLDQEARALMRCFHFWTSLGVGDLNDRFSQYVAESVWKCWDSCCI